MNHLDKAKAALESCDGWPINGTKDMALMAIANALVAIAEREPTQERIEDKSRWAQLFGTPERAARTLSTTAKCVEPVTTCRFCLYKSYCDTQCDFEALLEYLRGDA